MAASTLSKLVPRHYRAFNTPARSFSSLACLFRLGEPKTRQYSPSLHMSRLPGLKGSAANSFASYGHKPLTSRHFSAVAVNYDLRDGIEFGHFLEYLQEQYGLAQKAVEGKLSELANILGYEAIDLNTIIQYGDLKILLEELGANPASRREFRNFLEVQGYTSDESRTHDDVQEFYQLQRQQDVLDLAEQRGATIVGCQERRGWMQLTMANGAVLLFKST
eukprot:CAMPEP_0169196082 /NCGR_PEP_ID=MMETSP1016-20121227/7548_1 /TAXON_ID=342587 /ORGANISM="Karlodinium micrum, Strain CCMP2283" /LENGTH=219 /DNA_ID=CAMNT_0009272645 /DNA_START=90 /DNA_END=746 /DNA_ORIENTATION=-